MKNVLRASALALILPMTLIACAQTEPEPVPPTQTDAAVSVDQPATPTTEPQDSLAGETMLQDAMAGFTFEGVEFSFVSSSLGFDSVLAEDSGVSIEPAGCAAHLEASLQELDGIDAETVAGVTTAEPLRIDVSRHESTSNAQNHFSYFDSLLDHCEVMTQLQDGEALAEITAETFVPTTSEADEAIGFINVIKEPQGGATNETSQVVLRSGEYVLTWTSLSVF